MGETNNTTQKVLIEIYIGHYGDRKQNLRFRAYDSLVRSNMALNKWKGFISSL